MIIDWRYLYIARQSNTGMIDVRVLVFGCGVRVMRRVPVDEPLAITFVRKSTYSIRLIIHPNGGNAMQMVCDSCGAAYPFNWSMMKFTPCGFCAVRRQSGVRVAVGKWHWERLVEV